MLALCTSATAQTSANSTPVPQSPSASDIAKQVHELKGDTTELRLKMAESEIARLLRELRSGRKLTTEQSANLDDCEARLTAELANSDSLQKSYESALREIESLRKALDYAGEAIKAKDELAVELKGQRDKARSQAHKANKRTAAIGAVAGILIVLQFLK
jgi:chromosome segregation ATPase